MAAARREEPGRLKLACKLAQEDNQSLERQIEVATQAATKAKPTSFKEPRQWPSVNMSVLSKLGNDPETAGLLLGYYRAQQHRRYSSLYAALSLDEAGLLALNDLLAERAATRSDIAKVTTAGSDASATRELYARQFTTEITRLLGPDKAALVLEAERNPAWPKVNALGAQLAYQNASLNEAQLLSLLKDWNENSSQGPAGEEMLRSLGAGYLNPIQLAALTRALQQERVSVRTDAWIKDQRARWTKDLRP